MDSPFKESLIRDIGINRYKHSYRVMKTAIKLAKKYDVDENKATIAALLHDCGKFEDSNNLLKRVNDFDIILDNVMKSSIELIHGPLGAMIAREDYNIKDIEILDSIYYHTTGRENMTLLDKIIFIADYIEPGRIFPEVDKVRQLAFIDLDKSIILAMDNTIKYLIDKNSLIHLDTVKGRNFLKLNNNINKESI